MGNTSSTQSSKTQKDHKKESLSCFAFYVAQILEKTDDPQTEMANKKPKEQVTVIARAAGKLWARMSLEQRKKYVDLANAEKKRRQERKRKRKRLSTRSRMK